MTRKKPGHRNDRGWLVAAVVFGLLLPLQAQKERPQLRIEARILEWQHSNSLDVDFAVAYRRSADAGGSNLGDAGLTLVPSQPLTSATRLFFTDLETAAGSFDAVIETLEQVGTVNILSKPYSVVASDEIAESEFNNMKAKPINTATLSNVTEIPYESTAAAGLKLVSVTQYQQSGVSLAVSVQKVIDNNLIVLTMDTNVSDMTGFVNVGLNSQNEPVRVPTIDRRSIKNRMIVADGKVFIAGLMKTTQQVEQRRGIPWLGELPLLKYIFSSTRTVEMDNELVFLVKAEILTPYKPYAPADDQEADS
jgi:type II secretory pathway component GspD/PulD (secretin)